MGFCVNCLNCGHEMARQIVEICLCELSPPRKIDRIPALVCSECGARLYEGDVSIRLDDIRERFDVLGDVDAIETMLVYHYDTPLDRQTTLTFNRDDQHRMVGIQVLTAGGAAVPAAAQNTAVRAVKVYPNVA
jgi:hypothetical protein